MNEASLKTSTDSGSTPSKYVVKNKILGPSRPTVRRLESNKSVWDLANCKKRCYICTKLLSGNPSVLTKATTKNSNQTFATCLRDIADSQFKFGIEPEDRCCQSCASLIQTRDKALKELEVSTKTLFTYLKTSSTIRAIGSNKNSSDNDCPENAFESISICMKQQNQALLDEEVKQAANKSQVLYQCQVCKNMFASMKDVNGHMCRGKKTGKFTLAPEPPTSSTRTMRDYHCVKCGATFNTLLALYSHEKTHVEVSASEPVKYQECTICKLQFPSEDKLQAHMESHKRMRCNKCNVLFKSKDDFTKHIALTAKLHADFCITCSKIFNNKDALDAHLQQEHPQTDSNEHVALRVIYTCQCCNQEFSDMKSFSDHKTAHGIDQYTTVFESDKEIALLEEAPTDQLQKIVKLKNTTETKKPAAVSKVSNSQLNNLDHSYSLSKSGGSEEPIILDDESLDSSSPIKSVTPAKVQTKIAAKPAEQVDKPLIDKTKPCVFECGMCDIRANSLENLIKHFQTHKDKPIVCKHCNITLPSVSQLSKHLQYHTKSSQGVECLICRKPLSSKDEMLKHMADLHKMRHQCTFCGEQFRYMSEMQNHKTLHPESRQFTCLFCDDRFTTSAQLEKHQATVHRELKCSICGKAINCLKKLREHEQRHRRPVVPCTKCDRIFRTPGGLINHMPKHTGQYKYFCDMCNKGYMIKKVFVEHVNSHLEHPQMLYKCRYCEREFAYQGSLWIHELWHKNPFPYQCHLCGKKIRHASVLQVHLRRHRGERPYKCPHCPNAFANSGIFKRHMMLHTGNYAYNCTACKKGFTAKQKYHNHCFRAHGIPIPEKPKKLQYKISLGIPPMSDAATTYGDEDPLAFIVEDFANDQDMQQVMEVVTDEQEQAVNALALLEEGTWSEARS